MNNVYIQCRMYKRLERTPEDKAKDRIRQSVQTAFIPSELAFIGSCVRFEAENPNDNPWYVSEIGAACTEETLLSFRKAWKRWEQVLS